MKRPGITGKLVFSSACIFAALGLALIWNSAVQVRSLFFSQVVRRTEAQVLNWIEANTPQISVLRAPATLDRLVAQLREKKGIHYVVLLDEHGETLAQSGVPAGIRFNGPAPRVTEIGSQLRMMTDSGGVPYVELSTPVRAAGTGMSKELGEMFEVAGAQPTLGTVRVGIARREMDQGLAAVVRQNALSYAILVLLALTANILLARRMAKPVTALARAANQIAAGNLGERVQRGAQLRDEVGELVRNFNQMAGRLMEHEAEMERLNAGLEQKVAERTQALAQANSRLHELDKLKSFFVSKVSHELRSPLTSIKAFSEILLDSPPDAQTQRRFLDIIDHESDRLTRMISDLLDLGRIERNEISWRMAALDLPQVVLAAIAPLDAVAQAKGLRLEFSGREPVPVEADADRIQQVITNLVDNAIKFSRPGQPIGIRVRWAGASGPHKKLEGAYGLVSVVDSGPGIPPEETRRIFDKFYQVARTGQGPAGVGLGLGLAIATEIVEHHHGEIWVESRPGVGSTFYFTIPARPEGAGGTPDEAAARKGESPDVQKSSGLR